MRACFWPGCAEPPVRRSACGPHLAVLAPPGPLPRTRTPNPPPTRPGIIYAIVDSERPDRIRYVGQTSQTLANRRKNHLLLMRKGYQGPLYDWMREVGLERIEFVVLETVSVDRLREAEQVWIDRYMPQEALLRI